MGSSYSSMPGENKGRDTSLPFLTTVAQEEEGASDIRWQCWPSWDYPTAALPPGWGARIGAGEHHPGGSRWSIALTSSWTFLHASQLGRSATDPPQTGPCRRSGCALWWYISVVFTTASIRQTKKKKKFNQSVNKPHKVLTLHSGQSNRMEMLCHVRQKRLMELVYKNSEFSWISSRRMEKSEFWVVCNAA